MLVLGYHGQKYCETKIVLKRQLHTTIDGTTIDGEQLSIPCTSRTGLQQIIIARTHDGWLLLPPNAHQSFQPELTDDPYLLHEKN